METLSEYIEGVFAGHFWTRVEEMVDDIESIAFRPLAVVFNNDEYLIVADYETDEEATVYLGHANRTMWIQEAIQNE